MPRTVASARLEGFAGGAAASLALRRHREQGWGLAAVRVAAYEWRVAGRLTIPGLPGSRSEHAAD